MNIGERVPYSRLLCNNKKKKRTRESDTASPRRARQPGQMSVDWKLQLKKQQQKNRLECEPVAEAAEIASYVSPLLIKAAVFQQMKRFCGGKAGAPELCV